MTTARRYDIGGEGVAAEDEAELGALTVDLVADNGEGAVRVVQPLPAVPFVDIKSDYEISRVEIDEAIRAVVERGDFILGEAVERFESAFSQYCESEFAVGVDSGYSALELMFRAFGLGEGAEIITAANTFVATVGAIEAAGARPVLVDVDPVSYNMDPGLVEAAVTPATRAIVAVHLYGHPADMAPLREIADRHGLYLLEDAAQAHGSRYRGRRIGSLGDAAAFSFYPSKNLGAFGDGGMVTTSDSEVAARIRLLRNLGSQEKYLHETRGFNRRLDTLHAAVLEVKLRRLDDANESRRQAAGLYRELLPPTIGLPSEAVDVEHVYHLFVVRVAERTQLMDWLAERQIASGIHYPLPVHLQPAYRDLGYGPGDLPVAEKLAHEILSLPMYSRVPAVAVAQVAEAVGDFVGR